MSVADVSEHVICRDLSGVLTLVGEPNGARRYVKMLSARAATPTYRREVKVLQNSAASYAAPLVEDKSTTAQLSFSHDGWQPFATWRLKLHAEQFFPLETALRAAINLCAALQRVWEESVARPETHSGVVLFHENGPPDCRLLLWPAVEHVRPADYLHCTSEVLLCTPPEAFCGQENAQPHIYAAGMMLRQIFSDIALPLSPAALVEQVVGAGLPKLQLAPMRVPDGLGYALRTEFEQLAERIARATARRPQGRDVTLEQLADTCQTILNRLDYDSLMRELRHEGRFEEACDVGIYGAWAKSDDDFWRRALKRQCGDVYLNHLHKYERAATTFYDYLTTESQQERDMVAQVRENYADALAAMGLHGMALEQYEKAVAHIADRARLSIKIADTHRRHGDHRKAIATLNRLLNDNQKNWQALRDIAVLQLYYEKDPQTARLYAVSALQVVKDRLERRVLEVPYPERVVADLRALIGLCLLADGNADVAQTLATQALEEDDDCFRAHNIFGLLYIQQGKTVQAMRSLSASLRLKPDQPEIKRWIEDAFNRRSRASWL